MPGALTGVFHLDCAGSSDSRPETGPPADDPDVIDSDLLAQQVPLELRLRILEERLSKVEELTTTQSDKVQLVEQSLSELQDWKQQADRIEPSKNLHERDDDGVGHVTPPEKLPTQTSAMSSQSQKTVGRVGSRDSECEAIRKHLEYKWNDDLWDLAVFVGTSEMSFFASAEVVVCLALNILLLVAFSAAVHTLIADKRSSFDEASQQEFHFWRSTIAHDVKFSNSITGTSLASSVCNKNLHTPLSTLQLKIVDQLAVYLQERFVGLPSGLWMCILCVSVWYLVLVVELRSVLDVMGASMSIPHGLGTMFKPDQLDESKVHLVSISLFRKSLLIMILALRTIVVVILGWLGTMFLMYELDVEEMILNSLALQMMLSFDEWLFALIPNIPQAVTSRVMPQKIRTRYKWWHDWGLFIALLVFYSVAFAFFYILYMDPFLEQLRLSHDALCAGDHDFVVAVDAIGIPWAAPTQPSSDNVVQQYFQKAVTTAKKSGFQRQPLQSGQRSNKGLFMQVATADALERMMTSLPEFSNPTDWSMIDPFKSEEVVGWQHEYLVLGHKDFADEPETVYNHYLQYLLGLPGNTSCAQVPLSACFKHGRNAEHVVMRKLCPNRCGCASPTEGTVANTFGSSSRSDFSGCAAWNTRKKNFVDALDDLPCADTKSRDAFVIWSKGLGYASSESAGMLTDHLVSTFDSGKCPHVAMIKVGISKICQHTSLPAICPESCGCDPDQVWSPAHTRRMDFCPYSCNRMQAPCITVAKSHAVDTGTRGPHAGLACAFPFTYKGVTYNTCTSEDWSVLWCAVTLLDGVSHQWGDCADSFACLNASQTRTI